MNERNQNINNENANPVDQIRSIVDSNKVVRGPKEATIVRIVRQQIEDPFGMTDEEKIAHKNWADNMNA